MEIIGVLDGIFLPYANLKSKGAPAKTTRSASLKEWDLLWRKKFWKLLPSRPLANPDR